MKNAPHTSARFEMAVPQLIYRNQDNGRKRQNWLRSGFFWMLPLQTTRDLPCMVAMVMGALPVPMRLYAREKGSRADHMNSLLLVW